MRKLISIFTALTATVSAWALTPKDLTIYINPGHGGHDADDRNVVIEPFAAGDPEGYWESNSNLTKGLYLYNMLKSDGFNVYISRTTNTSADDLGLSTICALANKTNADFFFSIHSNATGTSSRVNFPLMLYRGYDNEPQWPNALKMGEILGKHLYENGVTVWTNNLAIRGDWSFYSWGTAGLGVLRNLAVDGMLSEGSFHDYIPETYRLMNDDFMYLEAWHFRKAIYEYFNLEPTTTGLIIGRINDSRLLRNVSYARFGEDVLSTIDGAKVDLFDESGKKLSECTTDKLYNGVYAFRDLKPGTYHIHVSAADHYDYETDVTVKADQATYANVKLNMVRSTPPVVTSYSPVWKEGDEPMLCNTPIVFNFNWDMDRESTEKAFSITPAVEGEFEWSDANFTMTFKPTKPYNISTEYTVKLDVTAEHAGGMKMENPVEFKFLTTNRNFMEMLGNYPKDGDKVHYKGAALELRFDMFPNVVPILNQISATDSKGNTLSFNKRSMKYSKKGDTYGYFRLPVTGDLTVGENYHLVISSEVGDKDGITLQHGYEIDFTAVDASEDAGDLTVIDGLDDVTPYSYNEDQSVGVTKVTAGAGGSSMKLIGTNSLKVDYTLQSDLDVPGEVMISRSEGTAETVTPSDVLSVRVYGDLTANELYAQFTSETAVKYVKIATLDFLGWENIDVALTDLEGSAPYELTGFKIVETPSLMSKAGVVYIDNVAKHKDAGVENVEVSNITIHPNPASEYIIANGDALVKSLELTSMNGQLVMKASGNVLNVSETPAGAYLVKVTMVSGITTVKKVIIQHN